jgi:hypothetical protein
MESSLSKDEQKDDFFLIRLDKLKKLTKTGSRLLPTLAGLLKL